MQIAIIAVAAIAISVLARENYYLKAGFLKWLLKQENTGFCKNNVDVSNLQNIIFDFPVILL